MSLTVLAIADEVHPALYDYFQPERWKEIDCILSAGDLPPDYLDYLCTRLNVPVFYVRGNHDGAYSSSQYDGFENVHGRIVTYKGVRIAGFEGSARYNDGQCQYSESRMNRVVSRTRMLALRHGTPDVVLTHAPVIGIHDRADLCHRGFTAFRRSIDIWRPSHFVHGHVHTYGGSEVATQYRETSVVNACPYRVFEVSLPEGSVGSSTPMHRHFFLKRPVV